MGIDGRAVREIRTPVGSNEVVPVMRELNIGQERNLYALRPASYIFNVPDTTFATNETGAMFPDNAGVFSILVPKGTTSVVGGISLRYEDSANYSEIRCFLQVVGGDLIDESKEIAGKIIGAANNNLVFVQGWRTYLLGDPITEDLLLTASVSFNFAGSSAPRIRRGNVWLRHLT